MLNKDNNLKIKAIIDLILLKKSELKSSTEADKRWINTPELVSDWPKDMAQKVFNFEQILRNKGNFTESEIQDLVVDKKNDIEKSYLDSRFKAPNKEYLRQEIFRVIDGAFEEQLNYDKAQNIVLLNFDLNGLKTVNDLSGHEKGDIYLRRVFDTLKLGRTTSTLDKSGARAFLAICGGDEFSILISGFSSVALIQEYGEIIKQYKEEVAHLSCSDLINFSDATVKEKFKGILIPDEYKYQASISGGGMSLAEALLNINESEKAKIFSLDYAQIINYLMGVLLDESDRRAVEDKLNFKYELEKGGDFLATILQRNDECVRLAQENKNLKDELLKYRN